MLDRPRQTSGLELPRTREDPGSSPGREHVRAIPIAHTVELPENMKLAEGDWSPPVGDKWKPGEALLEFAGRLCYLSFRRPNALTRKISDYLARIREQGHFSVYEHTVVSFYFDGISRNCGYEMLRHRHFSRSELSQRFVDMESARMVAHPSLSEQWLDDSDEMTETWWAAKKAYRRIVEHLTSPNTSRKQVREAARSVLPGMTETRLVQTGNLRAWRHFIKMRGNIHADAEIRMLAVFVADELSKMYPNAMADLEFYLEGGYPCVRLLQSES